MMDDQLTKSQSKKALKALKRNGLQASLEQEARKVNEALQASVEKGEIKAPVENVESLGLLASLRQWLGKHNLRATLTTLFKVCLWSLGIALALLGLYVLSEILFPI